MIDRRYYRGIFNLINLYIPICDTWTVVENGNVIPETIIQSIDKGGYMILNYDIWTIIEDQSKQHGS